MFGISGFELLIIAAFVLVIFGPDKLPELARTIGSAINMFKSAQQDMERVIRAEMFTGEKQEAIPADTAVPSPSASQTAANVWAATAEDDEDEEDEE